MDLARGWDRGWCRGQGEQQGEQLMSTTTMWRRGAFRRWWHLTAPGLGVLNGHWPHTGQVEPEFGLFDGGRGVWHW